jgi:AcrR family transcriptional regulator
MDDVAAAGVGKGTLHRRFTDKGGLAVALLDEREREPQAARLSGPAPLGPGAPAVERLEAFVAAYLLLVDRQLDLVCMSQTSPGRAAADWRARPVAAAALQAAAAGRRRPRPRASGRPAAGRACRRAGARLGPSAGPHSGWACPRAGRRRHRPAAPPPEDHT